MNICHNAAVLHTLDSSNLNRVARKGIDMLLVACRRHTLASSVVPKQGMVITKEPLMAGTGSLAGVCSTVFQRMMCSQHRHTLTNMQQPPQCSSSHAPITHLGLVLQPRVPATLLRSGGCFTSPTRPRQRISGAVCHTADGDLCSVSDPR